MVMGKREKDQRQRKVLSARKWAENHDSGRERTAVRIPEGMKLFRVKKECTTRLDFIPYVVGKGNPDADEGELFYMRRFHVHSRVGPNSDTFVCAARTWGEPCPVCDHRAAMFRDPGANHEVAKKLFPVERALWLVRDRGDGTGEGDDFREVQLLDVADFLFGQYLRHKINHADEDDNYDTFADPVEGKTLKIGWQERKGGGFTSYHGCDIEFKPREPLEEELLAKAVCLDDLLVRTPYDRLKQIFLQEPAKEPAREPSREASTNGGTGQRNTTQTAREEEDGGGDDDDDGDGVRLGDWVEHADRGKCQVVRVLPDGNLTLEDLQGKVINRVSPEDVERSTAPARPAPTGRRPAPVTEDGGEDDDLFEDDDAPPPPRKKR